MKLGIKLVVSCSEGRGGCTCLGMAQPITLWVKLDVFQDGFSNFLLLSTTGDDLVNDGGAEDLVPNVQENKYSVNCQTPCLGTNARGNNSRQQLYKVSAVVPTS